MSNYNNTKATIAANVYTNHANQVTAEMVKTAINAVVDTIIAGGFLYKGVAIPSTNPGSPDANVAYIATTPGTYTNFGSLVVADGEVAVLKYNGSWSKEVTGAATAAQVSALGQEVDGKIGGVLRNSETPLRAGTIVFDTSIVKPGDTIYMTLKNTNGAAQAIDFFNSSDQSLGSTYRYGWPDGGAVGAEVSYTIVVPPTFSYAKTLWGHGIAVTWLSFFENGNILDNFREMQADVPAEISVLSQGVEKNRAEIFDSSQDITTSKTWVNGAFSVSDGTITYNTYTSRARFDTPLELKAGDKIVAKSIDEDAALIVAYIVNGVATQLNNSQWGTYFEFTAEQDCQLAIAVKVGDLTNFKNDIDDYVLITRRTLLGAVQELMSEGTQSTDVNYLANIDGELIPKLASFGRAYKLDSTTGRKPLVLFHFSDLHASAEELARAKSLIAEHSTYIDAAIHTGDLLSVTYANPSIWDVAPATMLNVCGNHDCQTTDSTDANVIGVSPFSASWYLVTQTIPYNKLFAPYISGWDVTQPTNAAANGLMYYYKDFSTEKVRLIVLDGNYWDATQKSWLESTLASARTGGLSVLIASHYSPFAITRQPSNPFDSLDADVTVPMNIEAANAVESFISAGGEFVCWIGGHRHADLFGVGSSFPNQLAININTANYADSVQNDTARIAGTTSQDLFNVLSIDTYSKLVKVMRIGAKYDRYGRRKNTLCWNYSTKTMVYLDE